MPQMKHRGDYDILFFRKPNLGQEWAKQSKKMKHQNIVKVSTIPTAWRKTEGHLEIFFIIIIITEDSAILILENTETLSWMLVIVFYVTQKIALWRD